MKFVFTFALILTMLLALASLSTANAPSNSLPTPGDTTPTASVPQGGDGPASVVQSQPTAQSTAAPQKTADGWEVLAPGISYQEFHLDGPINVYVARMDQSNPNATIEAALANGQVIFSGKQQVSGIAQLYDGAINTWGREANKTQPWGMTNQVVVAINGQYTDVKNYVGESESGVITSGWYAKRYNDYWERSGFVWKYDRTAIIGGCIWNDPAEQLVKFKNGTKMGISGIDRPLGDNELVLYTPQYAPNTGTDSPGVEVLVEMSSPTMLLTSSRVVTGTVQSITTSGSTPIPYDSVVLSASGSKTDDLKNNVSQGDIIGITQEITNKDTSCNTISPDDFFTKAYASVGGHFRFLDHGAIKGTSDPGLTNLAPRTAIAYTQDQSSQAIQYVYFIVVDGRSKASIGMSMNMLANFAKGTLGATDGISEDGGGSSTMVVNGVIRNRPSDCRLIFMPLIANPQGSGATATPPPSSSTTNPAFYSNCERPVPDGMLMVISQPQKMSTRGYNVSTTVKTISDAYIRLGPGTNYTPIGIAVTGQQGQIQADPNGLNGVWAKGYFWWKVAFPQGTGWVAEINLSSP